MVKVLKKELKRSKPMKLSTKKIVLALTLTAQSIQALTLTGVSFFEPRAQSTNAAKDLVGWHELINKSCQDFYGAIAVTPSYGQLLRSRRAAIVMFGTDQITVSGSEIEDREENDFLADYFGLSPAFESCVEIRPIIRNAMIDFATYVGWQDFFFFVHAPAVWTGWKIRLLEDIFDDGTSTPYPAQYMAADAVEAPAHSFTQAVRGGITFGQMQEPLKYGKFGCEQKLVGFGDIQMALGWNFVQSYYGYAGAALRVTAPTGNRPQSEYLFEPLIGNGKHWEFGLGIDGKALLWEKDGEQDVSFYTVINIMHLCKTKQRRSFDLKANGIFSRYELAKEFDENGNYTGNLLPAINVTTLDCNVTNNIQFDIVLMAAYNHGGFVFDFGYNAWLRTADIITLRDCLPQDRYALKGIQNVTDAIGDLVNTTQSGATIHGNYLSEQADKTDIPSPQFFNTQDIDLQSAASPFVMTNKFFGHIGYAWKDYWACKYTPFIGIGGEIEVEGINQRDTVRYDKDTLSQWNLWVKGGMAF
jgi:hypothetical protein